MKRTTIVDRMMAEPIHFPGFPQIIVTRHFAYQWLKARGWNPGETGYGSLDYAVFGASAVVEYGLTPEHDRDTLLSQVSAEYQREQC